MFFYLVVNASKERKPKWQVLKNFQYIWVAKFQWAKLVVEVHGKLHYVRCKICTNVEHREKVIGAKVGCVI
jgi:NAD-dependent SIR2 family protein deacetylase